MDHLCTARVPRIAAVPPVYRPRTARVPPAYRLHRLRSTHTSMTLVPSFVLALVAYRSRVAVAAAVPGAGEALKFGGGSVAGETDDGVLQVIGAAGDSTADDGGAAVAVEQQATEQEEEEDKVRLWEAGWKERYYLHKFQISAMVRF